MKFRVVRRLPDPQPTTPDDAIEVVLNGRPGLLDDYFIYGPALWADLVPGIAAHDRLDVASTNAKSAVNDNSPV